MSGLSEVLSLLSYSTGMERKTVSSKMNWKHEDVPDNCGVFLISSVTR